VVYPESVDYIPIEGFEGTDTFTYKACDDSACDEAIVTVTVGPPNTGDEGAVTFNGGNVKQGDKPGHYTGTDNCMQDNFQNPELGNQKADLVCAAKEVTLQSATATIDGTCVAGEYVKVTINAEVHFNAARYDVAWSVPLDGGTGLTGDCAVTTLAQGEDYGATDGQVVFKDAKPKNLPADACGDIDGRTTLSIEGFMHETEILCQDSNGDGYLDVPVCFSWKTQGNDSVCHPGHNYPGTPSKCDCMTAQIPNFTVTNTAPSESPSAAPSPGLHIDTVVAEEPVPTEPVPTDSCMQDKSPLDLVCVSEDITIESVTAVAPASCIPGQTMMVSLEGSVTLKSGVTDPYWYVATDGGDALNGKCSQDYLKEGGNYPMTNDGIINYDDNSCGDVVVLNGGSTTLTDVPLLVNKEIPCVDENGDGMVDVSICFSWNDGQVQECGLPGSESACGCATYDVPNLTVTTPDIVKACT